MSELRMHTSRNISAEVLQ